MEGQVRGIARMVEEDKYCIDVLTQVSAATRALQSVALNLLEEHLSHCVADAVAHAEDDPMPWRKARRGADGHRPAGEVVTSATYLVTGMTCAHCVAAVTKELEAVEGVERWRCASTPRGRSSPAPPTRPPSVAAVEEAGYSARHKS